MNNHNVTGVKSITDEFEQYFHMYFKLFLLLYADDTVLLSDSVADLQLELDIFQNYCNIWRLKVNIDKTKVVIFSKGRANRDVTLMFGGEKLEIAKDFNYLGVLLSQNGSFNEAKNGMPKKP